MAEFEVGSVIGGLRIDAPAGRGGMGVVYRATQLALNRTVALKVVAPALADDPEFRERFKRESELAASIDHPHVIPIFSAGEENGLLYVTMRFVEGTDLRQLIQRDGRLDPHRAVEVVSQVAGALGAAHARGLVHRDVKPANILIGAGAHEGSLHAYLTDFGLTKRVAGDPSDSGLTRTGTVLGTLDYIAPEQLEGQAVDGRADIYALGCVLYQALTGQVPFPRDSDAARMWAHIRQTPPMLAQTVPELPVELDAVVQRAMAKDPRDRFASAGEFGRAASAACRAQAAPGGSGENSLPGAGATVSAIVPTGWPGGTHPADASLPWPAAGSTQQIVPAVPTRPGPVHGGQPPGAGPPGRPAGAGPPGRPRNHLPWVLVAVGVLVVLAVVLGAVVLAGGTPLPPAAAGQIVGAPIPTGPEPLDIDGGEGFLWTANAGADTISKIDPKSGASEEIVVGGVPTELVVDQGAVWVWSYSDSVIRVDVASGQVSDPILTGPAPISSIAKGNGYLWLSHSVEGTVSRLNMATQQIEGGPVKVGGMPFSMVYGDGVLYVVNTADRTVSTLDGSTGQVLGTPLAVDQAEGGVFVHDGVIYLGTVDDVTPVDERSFAVGNPIPSKGGSLFTVGAGSAWTVYPLENEIRRVDQRTRAPRGEPIRGVGKGAGDLYLADDGDLWLADADANTVVRIRPTP